MSDNLNLNKLTTSSSSIIILDGLPINEYIITLKQHINNLNDLINKQQIIIDNINKNNEIETNKINNLINKNNELLNRIIILENKNDINEIKENILKNEKNINELLVRPIVDISESIRLSIVEKKLASFYGDDINILGRVAHLENLRTMDKEVTDGIQKSIKETNNSLDEINSNLTNLNQMQTKLSDEIKTIQKKKVDTNQLETNIAKHLEQYPTHSDLNTVKDLINSLANEQNEELNRIQENQIIPLQNKNREIINQIEELLANRPHEPSVTCYGADQSARISALELQQVKLEYLPQTIEELRRNISKLEEQSFQTMKTNLSNENEIHKLESSKNKLENAQNKQMKLIEQIQLAISTINSTLKNNQQENDDKLRTKLSHDDIDKIFKEINERPLKEFKDLQASLNSNNETTELMKEYCKELEKRLLLLASECRDGLEYIQNNHQEQYDALIKWVEKNILNRLSMAAAAASTQNGSSTDIGVKCLACNRSASNGINPKTFFENYHFPKNETNETKHHTNPSATYRINVPETLRGLVSKSRETTLNDSNNSNFQQTPELPQPSYEDLTDTNDFRKKSNQSSKVHQGFPARPTSASRRFKR